MAAGFRVWRQMYSLHQKRIFAPNMCEIHLILSLCIQGLLRNGCLVYTEGLEKGRLLVTALRHRGDA
ncbi:hypothetical protein CLV83_3363 [Marinobacterium mangrovicola]|uniref:Uncharacterized protein n=1 Tax=Marinobacterium mangrovicola TaxID=1476959 RepID=A0A4R1GDH0_9GAMM|nr:hypothetical protein CLV83_3363 [Marinobacterium mangrovicola]